MKRTPLQRRTALKRKTPMNRISKKRMKLMRLVGPARKEFVAEIGYCEVCWHMDRKFVNSNLVVHEIAKGPAREKALSHRAAQLVVCNYCNTDRLEDYNRCPIELQLAIKLLDDWEHFDLSVVNKLRGRAETAITIADLVPYLTLRR